MDQVPAKISPEETLPTSMSPEEELLQNLHNWEWRMNNLYWIVSDHDGPSKKMKFRMNEVQRDLFFNLHNKNVVLKARQFGITTFMALFQLDAILWNPDIDCGFVAHTADDASDIFVKKIRYAYDNLPEAIKAARPYSKKDGGQLTIVHKYGEDGKDVVSRSSVKVGVSLRSGTYAYIHISELGKICAKDPSKADEVISGTLNSGTNAVVTIESTAEGNIGHFHNICRAAERMQLAEEVMTPMDYRFFFFPWWKHSEYQVDEEIAEKVTVPADVMEYFAELKRDYGIELPKARQVWYWKKSIEQGDKMMQEFPSTSDEAFKQSIHGAYYADRMRLMYAEKRVGEFPWNPLLPVHTAWDLGVDDATSIWFFQIGDDSIPTIIDYEEIEDRSGLEGGAELLARKPYRFGTHIAPHDINVTEWGTGMTRLELAMDKHNILFKPTPRVGVADGIEASREVLLTCRINRETCGPGIGSLTNYRKEFDKKRGVYSNKPLHDKYSHGADAFRYLAVYTQMIGLDEFVDNDLFEDCVLDIPKTYQCVMDWKISNLYFEDGKLDGRYWVRGGISFPDIDPITKRPAGAAVLLGYNMDTETTLILDETEFSTVEKAVKWFNRASRRYGGHYFYHYDGGDLIKRHKLDFIRNKAMKPSPILLNNKMGNSDQGYNELLELMTLDRLFYRRGIAYQALRSYNVQTKGRMLPALSALICAVAGLKIHPPRSRHA